MQRIRVLSNQLQASSRQSLVRSCSTSGQVARFKDDWFRKYDTPTDGYIDSKGFMNRLPLRLESSEMFVYGTVDPKKMWADYADENFVPILVGGKAVISIWFNNFTDTDCGGSYLETWYNTFVTKKGEPPLELPNESPFSMVIDNERSLIYLQRVICGDAPGNPGAAAKAICGGRGMFGFPKHPELANISFDYNKEKTEISFNATHLGKPAVNLKVRLPEADEGAVTIPIEAETGPDTVIGAPQLGGTHKGHNGANQTRFGQAFKCTQHLKPWDPKTDTLEFGSDDHYATPIKRWGFEPVLKAHAPHFMIAAFKPSNWISGSEAAKHVAEHEKKLASGVLGGAL